MRLKLFDGQEAPDKFWSDIQILLKLTESARRNFIKKVMRIYGQRDSSLKWEEWISKKSEKQRNQYKRAIRILLFILQCGIRNKFTDELFSDDLKNMGFNSKDVKFFLSELEKNRDDIRLKTARVDIPIIPELISFRWRVDLKKSTQYQNEINEGRAIILLSVSKSSEDTDEIIFELSSEELESFIRTLKIVEEELIQTGRKNEKI